VLIAIPGTLDTGDEVSGWNIYHLLHGWPFVHLESTHYQNVGNSEDGRYRLSRLPWGMDDVTSAKEAAAFFTRGESSVQLNLRLEKERYRPHWIGKVGFWSDEGNWPVVKTGVHFTPRYIGMLLNLLCLALLAAIVAALSERGIRRNGRLLKYSLANLLIGTALIAITCAWIARVHLDEAAQARIDDQLQTLSDKRFSDNNELYYFSKSHESRFPLIISQLLNHGKHPWGALPFFRQVKSGHVLVRINEESDLDRLKNITNLVNANKYSVEVELERVSPESLKMLNALDGVNLVGLAVAFREQRSIPLAAFSLERDEADLARAQASQDRIHMLLDQYLLSKSRFARRKKLALVEPRLAIQKLAEQRKEAQAQKDNPRPFIGIYTEPLVGEDGIRIRYVANKSPADLVDLRRDDVILKIDDINTASPQGLIDTVSKYEVGDSVTLTVRRDGKEMKIKATLADNCDDLTPDGYVHWQIHPLRFAHRSRLGNSRPGSPQRTAAHSLRYCR